MLSGKNKEMCDPHGDCCRLSNWLFIRLFSECIGVENISEDYIEGSTKSG
mgnify:CR=1 FL=1